MNTSKKTLLRLCFGVLALVAFCTLQALAQVGSQGQISGFVRDSAGAAISGATVMVTDVGTKQQRRATTNADGYYVVANIAAAIYDVSVEQSGFKKSTQTNVKLDAAGKVSIDLTMQVGNVAETVTVEASATQLQESTATVGRTIEGIQVSELGLNGRNPIRLGALKAGVLGGGSPGAFQFTPGDGGFNVNGSRSDANSILLDGVQQVRTRSAGSTTGVVDVDTLQEVQILTSNFAPEFGRSSGSQMIFVTKSGTKEFHGGLTEFFRNNKLDANTWNRNRTPVTAVNTVAVTPPITRFNQPGYSIGGPVYIPGKFNTSKEKLFFFWADEWVRFRSGQTPTATVPSAALRSGDVRELGAGADGVFGTADDPVKDPTTGRGFVDTTRGPGFIPTNRLSPIGKAIVNAYPAANCIGCFPGATTNYIASGNDATDTRNKTLRVDYYKGNHHLAFRGTLFDWKIRTAFRGSFTFTPDNNNRPNRSAGLTLTSTLKPTLINEFTYGTSADIVKLRVGGKPSRTAVGITFPYIFPGSKELDDKIPTIAIANFTGIDGGPYPASSSGPIFTWADNLTWVRGSHTFKTGINIERSGQNDFDQVNIQSVPGASNNQNGSFAFVANRPGGTGVAVSDALLGLFSTYGEIGQKAYTPWRATTYEGYVQDNWKVSRKLTVEYGVRYNYWPPWHSLFNNIGTFDPSFYKAGLLSINPANGAVVIATGADYTLARFNGISLAGSGFPDAAKGRVAVLNNPLINSASLFRGIPEGISETHKNIFEPRLGLAYSLNDKTTIRVGAAVFHSRVFLNDSSLLGGNAPLQIQTGVENGSADAPGGVITSFADSLRFPFSLTAQDKVFKLPTSYNWSLTVQRELPGKFLVELGYIGKHSQFLQRERNINSLQPGQNFTRDAAGKITGTVAFANALRPYLGHGQIRLAENSGDSIYHSFQTQVSRRFNRGFSFDMAYTFSKSLDNTSNKRDVLPNAFNDKNIRGVSDFDRPHAFVANFVYELPIGKGRKLLDHGGVTNVILGGWQVTGITFVRSGGPGSISIPVDALGVGPGAGNQSTFQVASLRCPVKVVGASLGGQYFSDPTCFTLPAPGTEGNSGRNNFRGPITQSHDLALFKNFRFKENLKLQFRLETFNFLNHANFNGPNTNINDNNAIVTSFTDPLYGTFRPNASGPVTRNFGLVTSKTDDRRTVQLGLKLNF
ncbi:MAG: carboxypeptidase regulatory-like domain-containing protein [Acidobacteria bacterium]|nr:carboxypeptidase regulatory-like domain-containing protein [Acidobacteriota bacterium]